MITNLVLFIGLLTNISNKNDSCSIEIEKTYMNYVNFYDTTEYNLKYKSIYSVCVNDTNKVIEVLATYILSDKKYFKSIFTSFLAPNTYFKRRCFDTSTNCDPIYPKGGVTALRSKFLDSCTYIPNGVLLAYYYYSLFYSDFKIKNKIKIMYKEKVIGFVKKPVLYKYNEKQKHELTELFIIPREEMNKLRTVLLKWTNLVNKKGLEYVRKNRIDPLYGSGFSFQ